MSPVEDFIYGTEGNVREILSFLHPILLDLGLQDKIRHKIPFYYNKRWICYLNPQKEDTVELAFIRGNELSNGQGLLESKGRKQVMGITISEVHSFPLEAMYEILQEALILDETVPYTIKRTK